ncbi:MAG TPA: Bax inhibitor-1/YccA family protein [Haliscomenobacter sp.]|nr:Bax inhibitor-1/YccA family protein [Haliscomenobacter sp.]HOY16656.1 Bax inhibitor-1/YccA family protein [Haliscomenobacter sp.]HPH21903.1 Bax inhibitor-1/YccA family protein [Haliscomenobacter sp.]
MTKVFGWMAFALAITGAVAYVVAGSPQLLQFVFGNRFIFFGLIIGELLLVGYLSAAVMRMSANTATLVFLLYAVLNGLTLSFVFLIYTSTSIAGTFLITAGTFAAMSAYGYFTKNDLTKAGSLLFMALIGLVIASIVNIFLRSPMMYWIITYAGILIFVGLTAYDTQKIKSMNIIGNEGTEEDHKEAIMGALTLYLDFINLFLYLLRLFGNRK